MTYLLSGQSKELRNAFENAAEKTGLNLGGFWDKIHGFVRPLKTSEPKLTDGKEQEIVSSTHENDDNSDNYPTNY